MSELADPTFAGKYLGVTVLGHFTGRRSGSCGAERSSGSFGYPYYVAQVHMLGLRSM